MLPNTVTMCLTHDGQSEATTILLEYSNYLFTAVFAAIALNDRPSVAFALAIGIYVVVMRRKIIKAGDCISVASNALLSIPSLMATVYGWMLEIGRAHV